MADWALAVVRFALYGGLGLLFGLPFFVLTSGRGTAIWRMLRLSRLFAILAAADIILSLFGFALLTARMSDGLDPSMVMIVLSTTAVGWAQTARIAMLVAALLIGWLLQAGRVRQSLLALCGGIAVATLAWSGHGASDDGTAGLVHLVGDIVHLLAASAWIGALALLLALASPRGAPTHERLSAAHDALAGFSRMGTVIVGLLVLTGATNIAFTVGLAGLSALGTSPYGQLLIVKLVLFAGMLVCAALNRFRLVPGLQATIDAGPSDVALSRLRRSIAIETILAMLVLGLVAWFGLLEPPASA